jgi:hypothetical protein
MAEYITTDLGLQRGPFRPAPRPPGTRRLGPRRTRRSRHPSRAASYEASVTGPRSSPEVAPSSVELRWRPGVARISPDRYARDLTRLSQEIIQHLAVPDGAELEIRVEITARDPVG